MVRVGEDREMIIGPASGLVQSRTRRGLREHTAKLNIGFRRSQNGERRSGILVVE
jgi:hypothetical protein